SINSYVGLNFERCSRLAEPANSRLKCQRAREFEIIAKIRPDNGFRCSSCRYRARLNLQRNAVAADFDQPDRQILIAGVTDPKVNLPPAALGQMAQLNGRLASRRDRLSLYQIEYPAAALNRFGLRLWRASTAARTAN